MTACHFGTTIKLDEGFRLRHGWSDSTVGVALNWAYVKLSKNVDYRVDNVCGLIISQVEERKQEESGRAAAQFPKLGMRLVVAKELGRRPVSNLPSVFVCDLAGVTRVCYAADKAPQFSPKP
jgi:hypothetical protein